MNNEISNHVSAFLHALYDVIRGRNDIRSRRKDIDEVQDIYDIMEYQTPGLPTIHWEGEEGVYGRENGRCIDFSEDVTNPSLAAMYKDIVRWALDMTYARELHPDLKQFGFREHSLAASELRIKALVFGHEFGDGRLKRKFLKLAKKLDSPECRFPITEVITGDYKVLNGDLVQGFLQALNLPVEG